jgi:hypothetical protein
MERAGRVIRKLQQTSQCVSDEQIARAAWPLAVGKRIAARTSDISLIRSRLVVGVEDAVWQRQLFTLRGQILAKLEEAIGAPIVTEIEFRVVPPRRLPQRAANHEGTPLDEADEIRDPLLRSLYKASRRRASV